MISIPDKTSASAPPVPSPRQPLWRESLDGVPLVIPVVLTVVTVAAGYLGKIPVDMIGGLAVITGLGMILGPLGNRIPILSRIGGGALVCLMLPSILVFLNVLPDNLLAAANSLMKQANFLYFVICTLVVGSIVGCQACPDASASPSRPSNGNCSSRTTWERALVIRSRWWRRHSTS